METNKHGNRGGTFLWGLAIGALLTTLLSTKRGRQILRDLTSLGLELFEDFVEEKASKASPPPEEDIEEAARDLASEMTAVEEGAGEPKEEKPNGNGHKKRLFKGIRRPK